MLGEKACLPAFSRLPLFSSSVAFTIVDTLHDPTLAVPTLWCAGSLSADVPTSTCAGLVTIKMSTTGAAVSVAPLFAPERCMTP